MSDPKMQQDASEASAPATLEPGERQDEQDPTSEAAEIPRPIYRAAPGRRPLFRS